MVQQMDIQEQQVEIKKQGRKVIVSVPRSRTRNRNNLSAGRRSEYLLLYTTDA